MSVFGERLKQIRMIRNKTQKELSDSLGISLRMLQFLEAGQREPKLETFHLVCDLLNCSADYLLGRVDDPLMVRDDSDLLDTVLSEIKEMLKKEEEKGTILPSIDQPIADSDKLMRDFLTILKMNVHKKENKKDPL